MKLPGRYKDNRPWRRSPIAASCVCRWRSRPCKPEKAERCYQAHVAIRHAGQNPAVLSCALERADLFGVLAKVFCDSQRLTFADQLRACAAAAVCNVKLGALDTRAIEKRALGKLESAGETLRTFELVREFEKRSRLVTQYVARVVTDSAAEVFEAEGQVSIAAKIPKEAAK